MKGRLPEGGCSDAVPGGWAHQDGYSSLGGVPAGEADGNWVGGDEKAVSVIARGTVLEQSLYHQYCFIRCSRLNSSRDRGF